MAILQHSNPSAYPAIQERIVNLEPFFMIQLMKNVCTRWLESGNVKNLPLLRGNVTPLHAQVRCFLSFAQATRSKGHTVSYRQGPFP